MLLTLSVEPLAGTNTFKKERSYYFNHYPFKITCKIT